MHFYQHAHASLIPIPIPIHINKHVCALRTAGHPCAGLTPPRFPLLLSHWAGEAHEGHWKQQEGVVIAILNPKKSDKEENNKEHKNAAYNVSNSGQLLVIGRSKDYGKCKSLRKDGQPCTKVVNLSTCPYCEHHMAGEYKKINSKRANLNDWVGAPGGVVTVAVSAQVVSRPQNAQRRRGPEPKAGLWTDIKLPR